MEDNNKESLNDLEDETSKEFVGEKIQIDDKARLIIYICLVAINTFSSCDGGIIPQQIENIKEDFGNKNEDSLVGFFGSSDYLGRVLGGLIFSIIMGKYNRKMLLVATLLFKAFTLIIAFFTKNSAINIIARCLSGISQVFYTTYLPVWCDQYGKKSNRAIMVTIVQLGNPIGVIIGYGLGLVCDTSDKSAIQGWRIAFGIEGIILIICGFIIFSFKNKYFSCNFILLKDNEGKEEIKLNKDKDSLLSSISNYGKILCNKIFLFTTLSNSVAFFGMSVVQYWGDKYMEKVLGMNEGNRFIAFSCLCLLGPILGMTFGGILCTKLGGYGKKKSMTFTITLILIATIISSIIAIHKISWLFILSSWSYLFFICASIPPESGIIISSLENNLRGDGFALSNCLLNLIGNFPASYAFSILSDLFDKNISKESKGEFNHYRYAWIISMLYNIIGFFFIFMAGIYRFKIKGDLAEEESKQDDSIISDISESKENEAFE